MGTRQIVLIIPILFLSFLSFGQEGVINKDYQYNVPKGSVVRTYFDKTTTDYLVAVISESYSKLYLNGELITTLTKNEEVLGMEGNQLYIVKFFKEKKTKEVTVYRLNPNSISKIKSKVINHLEVNTRFINGHLVVSDDIEGFGTVVEFFDDGLNSIIAYHPFTEGYYSSEIIIENNIATVFSNALGVNKTSKITKFNLTTSQLIFEKDITIPNTMIKKIYLLNDGVIIYGSTHDNQRKVIKFDNSGNLLWTKDQLLPMFHKGLGVFESIDNTKLYLITKKTIISVFDSKSGRLIKDIDLKKINENALSSNHIISSFVVKPNGELIVLSGDLDWDEIDVNTFHFKNNNIYILNIANNTYSSKFLTSNFKRPRISFINDSILIKSEKKQVIIEMHDKAIKQIDEK